MSSHPSLKNRLASYLKRNYSQAWVSSGALQRIVADAHQILAAECRP
jgi:hypothetical protein